MSICSCMSQPAPQVPTRVCRGVVCVFHVPPTVTVQRMDPHYVHVYRDTTEQLVVGLRVAALLHVRHYYHVLSQWCVCASLGNSYRYIYSFVSVLTLCNISLCLPQYLCITHSSPGPPSAPQVLSVSTKNATAVVMSWFPPQDSGGVGVVYTVYYQTVYGSQRMTLANITTTSVTVTNLSPGTEYMITVVADNGLPGEEASRSASVTVTTEGVSTSILVVITLFKYMMYMYMILRINVYFCIPCTCISPAHTHLGNSSAASSTPNIIGVVLGIVVLVLFILVVLL